MTKAARSGTESRSTTEINIWTADQNLNVRGAGGADRAQDEDTDIRMQFV